MADLMKKTATFQDSKAGLHKIIFVRFLRDLIKEIMTDTFSHPKNHPVEREKRLKVFITMKLTVHR